MTSTATHTYPSGSSARTTGLGGAAVSIILAGLIGSVGAAVCAIVPGAVPATQMSYPLTPEVFTATEILWSVSHVLMLLGAIGLVRSRLAGTSGLARIGSCVTLIGLALMIPAELGFVFLAAATKESTAAMTAVTAIGLASCVASVGLTLFGIAVIRSNRWHGWGRSTPLLCGLFVLAVLLPVLAIHPSVLLWSIAGWNVCWVVLGAALLGEFRKARQAVD